jgi:hypothetical protein
MRRLLNALGRFDERRRGGKIIMKVEDLREKKHDLEFSDLAIGSVFKKAVPYGEDWTFMKISTVTEFDDDGCKIDDYNAVCLDDGDFCWFEWDEGVIKVEAKLVIEK